MYPLSQISYEEDFSSRMYGSDRLWDAQSAKTDPMTKHKYVSPKVKAGNVRILHKRKNCNMERMSVEEGDILTINSVLTTPKNRLDLFANKYPKTGPNVYPKCEGSGKKPEWSDSVSLRKSNINETIVAKTTKKRHWSIVSKGEVFANEVINDLANVITYNVITIT